MTYPVTPAPDPVAPDTIDVSPTFKGIASILIALFENGTFTGKQEARNELYRWAAMLDRAKEMQTEAKAARVLLSTLLASPDAPEGAARLNPALDYGDLAESIRLAMQALPK